MVEFCREQSIPYEICGKVVVATDPSELPGLEELMRRGTANGVPGLAMISQEQLRSHRAALYGCCRDGGAGDGHYRLREVAQKIRGTDRELGGQILTGCEVVGIRKKRATRSLWKPTRARSIQSA